LRKKIPRGINAPMKFSFQEMSFSNKKPPRAGRVSNPWGHGFAGAAAGAKEVR
jgi:hypothetical protein